MALRLECPKLQAGQLRWQTVRPIWQPGFWLGRTYKAWGFLVFSRGRAWPGEGVKWELKPTARISANAPEHNYRTKGTGPLYRLPEGLHTLGFVSQS